MLTQSSNNATLNAMDSIEEDVQTQNVDDIIDYGNSLYLLSEKVCQWYLAGLDDNNDNDCNEHVEGDSDS